jgi:hypothetical protein
MDLDDAMGILKEDGTEVLDDDGLETFITKSGMLTSGDGYFYVPDDDKIWDCKPDTIEYNMFLAARPLMEKRAFENGKFACFEPVHYSWTTFADREYLVKVKVDQDEYAHAIIRRRPPLYDPQEKLFLTHLMVNQSLEDKLDFSADPHIEGFYEDFSCFWEGPKRPPPKKSRATARGLLVQHEIE